MAGPCVSIFTRRVVSAEQQVQVRAMIGAIAGTVKGDDFWLASRPFVIEIGEPESDLRELVIDGWSPAGETALCAMCNDPVDHILLGALACRAAEILDGLIAVGDLTQVTQVPTVLAHDGRYTISGEGDFVTARFLANWLSNPEFRLLK